MFIFASQSQDFPGFNALDTLFAYLNHFGWLCNADTARTRDCVLLSPSARSIWAVSTAHTPSARSFSAASTANTLSTRGASPRSMKVYWEHPRTPFEALVFSFYHHLFETQKKMQQLFHRVVHLQVICPTPKRSQVGKGLSKSSRLARAECCTPLTDYRFLLHDLDLLGRADRSCSSSV